MSDSERFLSRWSRRKVEARGEPDREAPAADDAASVTTPESVAESMSEPTPPAELPPVDSLQGLESDYCEFLKPDVPEGTQRAALKKLFADPHFNQMDGLDVYIDDYNKFEPMSAAIAASLQATGRLSVFDHLESEVRAAAEKALQSKQTGETAGAPIEADPAAPSSLPESSQAIVASAPAESGDAPAARSTDNNTTTQ